MEGQRPTRLESKAPKLKVSSKKRANGSSVGSGVGEEERGQVIKFELTPPKERGGQPKGMKI
jgi:hypothetical protein